MFPDISGSNIAFTIGELAHSSNEVMLKTIGRPEWVALLRVDGEPLGPGLPAQLVKNAGWDDWIDEDEEDIRLIDLGEAFAKGTEPARLAQPAGLEAPETIFMDRFDHKVDLWRAGCTVRLRSPLSEVHGADCLTCLPDILNGICSKAVSVPRG